MLGGTAYVTRLPEVTVSQVTIAGAIHADVQAVTATVESVLNGTYALIVPKRMSYVVPNGAVVAAVVGAFPLVESVTVTRASPRELRVQIAERAPHALWCNTTCYRMDTYGFIFAQADLGDQYRTYEGGDYAVGQTFLLGDFHDFDRFVSLVEGISPSRIPRVRVEGDDAFLLFENGGEIRVVRTTDPGRTVARIEAVFTSESFDATKKLDYVEFRFGDKALVKFKN